MDTPRIYVACLASYNNGMLHGEWIDLGQGLETVQDEIQVMLKASPMPDAEEHAIHDYEGFGELRISEYVGLQHACEMAAFIIEHEEVGLMALEHACGDIDDAKRYIESYAGCYTSVADYAEELTEDTTEIPQHLHFYIDYEKMGRDMELGGDIFTIEKGYQEVHIFWNH